MSALECLSVLAGVEAITARGQPRHGQLVEAAPMSLHYLTLGIVSGCAGLFATANIIARHVK